MAVTGDAADSNNDEKIDISDPIHTFSLLFLANPTPVDPVPRCDLDEGSIGLLYCEPPLPLDACFR